MTWAVTLSLSFVTEFADILTWEKGRYIRIVKYKDGTFEGIAAGFDFFWWDLADDAFNTSVFEIEQYKEAVRKWDLLQFDECFGYVLLLDLGGSKKVDNLRKVKIKEHIQMLPLWCQRHKYRSASSENRGLQNFLPSLCYMCRNKYLDHLLVTLHTPLPAIHHHNNSHRWQTQTKVS